MSSITSVEMAALDLNADYLGVSRISLMENAGRAVAEAIIKRKEIKGKDIAVLAGRGDNGGDGFVAARYLADTANVTVFLLGNAYRIKTYAARKNWELLKKTPAVRLVEIQDPREIEEIKEEIIIDAILGTGVAGELREPIATAVERVNSAEKSFVVAVDCPTGIDPDTGNVLGNAVQADLTVTFHRSKVGLKKAKKYCGEIVVADIGIPPEAERICGPGDLYLIVRKRDPAVHKGDFGKVLVVGGSYLYTGAPALAAMAAYRAGVDLVYVAAPESVANVIASFSPNLIVRQMPGDMLSMEGIPVIRNMLPEIDAVVVGPGLGDAGKIHSATRELLEMINELGVPTVIDADGLKAVAEDPSVVKEGNFVLTPHAGEFKFLFGKKLSKNIDERAAAVRDVCMDLGITILLKGFVDVVGGADGSVKINRTGVSGMTVGGTGDVLSGLTAGFSAQGARIHQAACAAAFVNGLAGERAARDWGYHLTAMDIVDVVGKILRYYQQLFFD